MKQLADYRGIVSDAIIDEIGVKARELKGATVVHVNATNFGGGVAEILDNLVPLMNDIGLRADWRVLHGVPDFFEVTKKFHNALQGQDLVFDDQELQLFKFINEKFARFAFLDHDFVIIHDPQPAALVQYVAHTNPWVWRCHIDITHPSAQAWSFMEPFILEYQRMIVSAEEYKKPDLRIPQQIMAPSIDPISPKNMDLPEEVIARYLDQYRVPTDKPFITQVSRFDPWKDPEGVLKVFELVKQQVDCRLVYCYNMSADDPEGVKIYKRMLQTAKPYLDSGDVLFIRGDDPVLVNVLQRTSSVILQKSTREGFGLTVTEAMWKGTPVVASNVGGIPTQIKDGVTGFLVEPLDLDGCAEKVVALLEDTDLAARIGQQAREYAREHFLITRHLLDYVNLLLSLK
ncbi:MAG: glycosyltransferase [Candidatus Marinimicrobia bacterium]|nr:glycosyltransferase [Candidatus Neomarinimicrobiota bacterium]